MSAIYPINLNTRLKLYFFQDLSCKETTCHRSHSMFLSGFCIMLINCCFRSAVTTAVCQTEQYEASCDKNEVVLMTSSLYGRMKHGKCVDKDYGFLGCMANVLTQLDGFCSGRRQCQIAVPNAAFENSAALSGCPKDLKQYLEASHICLPGKKFSDNIGGIVHFQIYARHLLQSLETNRFTIPCNGP